MEMKVALFQIFKRTRKAQKAGYTGKVVIGINVVASKFYGQDKTYDLNFKEENNDGSNKISGYELIKLYESFVDEYPIISIEDPFDYEF